MNLKVGTYVLRNKNNLVLVFYLRFRHEVYNHKSKY